MFSKKCPFPRFLKARDSLRIGALAASKYNYLLTGSEEVRLNCRRLFFYEVNAFLQHVQVQSQNAAKAMCGDEQSFIAAEYDNMNNTTFNFMEPPPQPQVAPAVNNVSTVPSGQVNAAAASQVSQQQAAQVS